MTEREASQELHVFEQTYGQGLLKLASHAAMPVVLNAELVHLLRINYFLDPPDELPFSAESILLLSAMCTEIDDGFYTMAPAVRDLLLKRLVENYGATRVREVARLIWEYSYRYAPWHDRPGLTEAQQLTALNFIDHNKAMQWLDRARRGEGSLPVDDEQWFVVLERDLVARASAFKDASETTYESAKLPALVDLRDALMKHYKGSDAPLRIARQADLVLSGTSDEKGPNSLWQAVLDSAWNANRMPALLQTITTDLGARLSWMQAMQDYWFRMSPALRVVNGRFEDPPPEWQVLERHRSTLQEAIGALVVIVVERLSLAAIHRVGVLAGDHVVLTHELNLEVVRPYSECRFYAEFAEDHLFLGHQDGVKRRISLRAPETAKGAGLVALTIPLGERSDLPKPMRVNDGELRVVRGRNICVAGYPTRNDQRVETAAVARVLGESDGDLRLQPGEVLGQGTDNGPLFHNCFTTAGNGGSPVIDVETGLLLGIHFASTYSPGPAGLKRGEAVDLSRLTNNAALVEAGVFRSAGPPEPDRPHLPRPSRESVHPFINRHYEQDLFVGMMERGRGALLIEGPPGMGKTALLQRFAHLAEKRGVRTAFVRLSEAENRFDVIASIRREFGLPPSLGDFDIKGSYRLPAELIGVPVAIFIDDVERSWDNAYSLFHRPNPEMLIVLAGRTGAIDRFPDYRRITLEPFGVLDLREWIDRENFEPELRELLMGASLSKLEKRTPAQVALMFAEFRRAFGTGPAKEKLSSQYQVRTSEITHIGPVVFHDNPNESHGDWVATRGSHTLQLPRRYSIALTPVTNALFLEFVREGSYTNKQLWRGASDRKRSRFTCRDGSPGPSTWASQRTPLERADHPVSGISYYEAQAFVEWLRLTVSTDERMQWCLPTEDMWEFAARGREGLVYPWGHTFETGRCNSREAGLGTTSQIGSYPEGRSPYGIEDMSGNVWEFVRTPNDLCVLRGGSFTNTHFEVKNSLRLYGVPPDHRPPDFGFRCAVEPKPIS